MALIVQLMGLLIAAAGVTLALKPEIVMTFLRENMEKHWLQAFAISVRILLGALLLTTAYASKFPTLMTVFGWIAIFAAIFLVAIGAKGFVELVTKVLRWVQPYTRVGGIISALFGLFLVFAYL